MPGLSRCWSSCSRVADPRPVPRVSVGDRHPARVQAGADRSAAVSENASTVILNVRLPRIFAAVLIGAGLAMSGGAYQGMFRNPLVSSDILGASAGAGFGAALGIMLSKSVLVTQILALGFGLAAVLLTYVLAGRLRRGDPTLFLVLTGILVGTVFTSLISILKVLADPYDKLPAITFWLMGSLAAINRSDVLILLGPMVVGGVALLLVRWHLNPLSFGEEEAQAMGVETGDACGWSSSGPAPS